MSDTTQPVKSPCIEVCSLNNEDVCIGCYRTANEIIEWFSAPNERKREILQRSISGVLSPNGVMTRLSGARHQMLPRSLAAESEFC